MRTGEDLCSCPDPLWTLVIPLVVGQSKRGQEPRVLFHNSYAAVKLWTLIGDVICLGDVTFCNGTVWGSEAALYSILIFALLAQSNCSCILIFRHLLMVKDGQPLNTCYARFTNSRHDLLNRSRAFRNLDTILVGTLGQNSDAFRSDIGALDRARVLRIHIQ